MLAQKFSPKSQNLVKVHVYLNSKKHIKTQNQIFFKRRNRSILKERVKKMYYNLIVTKVSVSYFHFDLFKPVDKRLQQGFRLVYGRNTSEMQFAIWKVRFPFSSSTLDNSLRANKFPLFQTVHET